MKKLGDFIDRHFDTLFGYFIGALTSGSVSALISKLFEKKIFEKVSLGWCILTAVILFVSVSVIVSIIRKKQKECRKEIENILTDLARIMELSDWDNFICGAEKLKFNFSFCDERDNLRKYFEEHEELWTNKEKKVMSKIKDLKNSFENMYVTLSKHLMPNVNASYLIEDKSYKQYYGRPDSLDKEKEYDAWVNDSWVSINQFVDNLNDLVSYAKKKKYTDIPECWKKKFLNHSYDN